MPRITKDGVSDARDIVVGDDASPEEVTAADSDDGDTVTITAVADAEVIKPKKATTRKATR